MRKEIEEEIESIGQKIILLGEKEVGKSSLLKRVNDEQFSSIYHATIGINTALHICRKEDYDVRERCWDIAGNELHGHMISVYVKDAQAIVYVADINDEETIEALTEWNKKINGLNNNYKQLPRVLVITKLDKFNLEKKEERKKLIEQKAGEIGVKLKDIYYTSSMTGKTYDPENDFSENENVEVNIIFSDIATKLVEFDKKKKALLKQFTSAIASLREAAKKSEHEDYYNTVAGSLEKVKNQIQKETDDDKMSGLNETLCKFFTEETETLTELANQNKKPSSNYAKKLSIKLDMELYHSKPPSHGVRTVICMLIGALMGLAIGFVLGAAITAWGGGFGAIPGAIAGAVTGASLTTTLIAGGAGAAGAVAGGALGVVPSFLFYKRKKSKYNQKKAQAENPSAEVEAFAMDAFAAVKAKK